MAGKEIENVENVAAKNQENKQPEIKRMVVFEYDIMQGVPNGHVRGVPNMITYNASEIKADWTKSTTEIGMDNRFTDFLQNVAKQYRTNEDMQGAILINRVEPNQYWARPIGTTEFVRICNEVARELKLHVIE